MPAELPAMVPLNTGHPDGWDSPPPPVWLRALLLLEFGAEPDPSKCSLASTIAPVKGHIYTRASPHHGPIP